MVEDPPNATGPGPDHEDAFDDDRARAAVQWAKRFTASNRLRNDADIHSAIGSLAEQLEGACKVIAEYRTAARAADELRFAAWPLDRDG